MVKQPRYVNRILVTQFRSLLHLARYTVRKRGLVKGANFGKVILFDHDKINFNEPLLFFFCFCSFHIYGLFSLSVKVQNIALESFQCQTGCWPFWGCKTQTLDQRYESTLLSLSTCNNLHGFSQLDSQFFPPIKESYDLHAHIWYFNFK